MSDIPKLAYTGGMSPLSQPSPDNMAMSRLLSQMGQAQQKKIEEKVDAISGRYGQQLGIANREMAKWKDLIDDVGKATSDISAVVGRLKAMQSKVNSMIAAVNKADQRDVDGEYSSSASYAKAFDSLLKSLNADATKANKSPNMLGTDGATYNYRVGIHGQSASISSAYLGSEYSITDTEGKKWAADLSVGLLQRYDDYPGTKADESGNFVDGIQLDSQSGSDVTFTVAPNTADPKQFTGTIDRKGLRLANAWYYDGMSTAEGRSRALEDLNDAKEALGLEIGRYGVAFKTAKFYEERAHIESDGYKDKMISLQLESATEIGKAQEDLVRQYRAAQGAVAQNLAMKTNYASIFQSMGTSFGNRLVSLLT